jgi:fumarylacetoacetate (FAA) hydrolase
MLIFAHMKFTTFRYQNKEQAGIVAEDGVYNLNAIDSTLPKTMLEMLQIWSEITPKALQIQNDILAGKHQDKRCPILEVEFLAPVPNPTSCRDGYAFRQHVAAARRNRKVPMIEEFDQYPIFYFTNHNAVQGPGDVLCMPDHFNKLDFELEVAVVLGKRGRNIKAEHADSFIAGYTIMNDMSARTLQMEEMLLNLGPAKGKDFSTVIGPWMVTPDELSHFLTKPKVNHTGNNYSLEMRCWVNGTQVSHGNMGDMDWTFAEIIERCSYGADVLPGDVIGSGTVGTGCFLELNGTGLLENPNYQTQWLKEGDIVEMEITGLGRLKNTIVAEKSDFSLLALKKL